MKKTIFNENKLLGDKMKEYEKRALSILLGALVFSYFSVDYFIVLILLLLAYIYVRFINKESIFLIFFLLPPIFYPMRTSTKPLESKKIYELKVNVVGNKVEVLRGKLRRYNKEYIIRDKNLKLKDGRYELKYKIDKIDKFYKKYYLDGSILNYNESFFNRITRSLHKQIKNSNYSIDLEKFSYGVIIGDKTELSNKMKDLFRKTGASHLLAISGLHIGIVVAFFLFFFSLLPISYKLKYSFTLLFLTLYILTLQLSPSVQRAYIMSAIFLLSKIFLDKSDNKKSLAFALGISLCFNMELVFNVAFQLSYLALFSILYLYKKGKNLYIDTLKFSFLIQLALTPVFIYNFNSLPILTFLTNIVVVFIGSILIGMLYINLFLGYLSLSFLLKNILELIFDILYKFLEFVEKIPMISIELTRFIPKYIYITILIAIILYPFIKIKKAYLPLLIIPIFYYTFPYRVIEEKNYVYFPKEKLLLTHNLYDREKYIELINKYKVKYLVTDRDKKISKVKIFKVKEGDVFTIKNIEVKYEKNELYYEYK